MHSPAEEVGLMGQRLATRVQHALDGIPRDELVALLRDIRRTATERHLAYQHEGVTETSTLLPCPLTMRQDQLGYSHYVSQIILNAIKRLPELYFEVPEVRDVLRVSDVEEEWLRECWTPAHLESDPVFGRFDAVVDYTSPMWKDTIKFMEPNLIGIGGLHIAPTAIRVLADLAVPALLRQDPSLRLQLPGDMRDLLLQDLLDHLETVGRPGGQIVLVDPKFAAEGPDEPDALARWYREHRGIDVLHADPSELRQRGDEVYYGDGVMVGHSVEQGIWESALARALAEPNGWVLQQAAPIPVKSFHVLDDATGEVHVEPFYVVMGFASNRYGVAMLARASQSQVVNVAQHGGVCAVMVGAQAVHTREYRIPTAGDAARPTAT
jgi:hypothetical protein